uniref:Uncharacterized protein n=1 Tax=Anguilla anguilla TaxID=7936 RepID=A0A0E9UKI4_ANGAN
MRNRGEIGEYKSRFFFFFTNFDRMYLRFCHCASK